MLESATLAGIDPIKFWEYTPFEINLIIKRYTEEKKQEHKNLMRLAYYTEALRRIKGRLPKLEKLIKEEKKKQQTPEDMLAEAKRLNAMMGGEVY